MKRISRFNEAYSQKDLQTEINNLKDIFSDFSDEGLECEVQFHGAKQNPATGGIINEYYSIRIKTSFKTFYTNVSSELDSIIKDVELEESFFHLLRSCLLRLKESYTITTIDNSSLGEFNNYIIKVRPK